MTNKFYTSVSSSYNNLLVTAVSNGQRIVKEVEYKPSLYVPDKNGTFVATDKANVRQVKFDNVLNYNNFVRENKNNSSIRLYGEISPEYQAISHWFGQGEIKFDFDLINRSYFDIEVSSLDKHDRYVGFPHASIAPIPIVSIAIYHSLYDKMYVWGLREYDVSRTNHKACPVTYYRFNTEAELLLSFANHLSSEQFRPDILYGWNSQEFDMVYIVNRCKILGGDKFANLLSPFRKTKPTKGFKKQYGRFVQFDTFDFVGIPHIDMMDGYRVFSGAGMKESYKLDFIAQEEKVGKKLDYGESKSIMDLFWDDHQRYIDYNIQDTYLLVLIDRATNISDRMLMTAYSNKCNYTDTLGVTKRWDIILYNEARLRNLIIPYRKKDVVKTKYAGGFVRVSKIGVQKMDGTIDVVSMYPNIMRMFNMSPETILEKWQEGCFRAPNGTCFDSSVEGILASTVEKFFLDRVYHKNEAKKYKGKDPAKYRYHDGTQYVRKIDINSAYGACGSAKFRYFDQRIAEAVTLTGQYLIKLMGDTVNKTMNRLVMSNNIEYFSYEEADISDHEVPDNWDDFLSMGDTDSCGISFAAYVNKFCQGMDDRQVIDHLINLWETEFMKDIDEVMAVFYKETGVKKEIFKLNFETIAKTSLYLAKKNYIGHIIYKEGEYFLDDEFEIKIKGVVGVRSSTPRFFRDKFKEFYRIVLCEDHSYMLNFMEQTFKDYKDLSYTDNISKPIKVNGLKKYMDEGSIFVSRTPENVRACLVYNYMLKSLKLEGKYDEIKEGDFVNLVKLNEPIYGSNSIAFPNNFIPEEFEINNIVDYKTTYDTYFLKSALDILEKRGWSLQPRKKKGLLSGLSNMAKQNMSNDGGI